MANKVRGSNRSIRSPSLNDPWFSEGRTFSIRLAPLLLLPDADVHATPSYPTTIPHLFLYFTVAEYNSGDADNVDGLAADDVTTAAAG
jgi:hypothetical protein